MAQTSVARVHPSLPSRAKYPPAALPAEPPTPPTDAIFSPEIPAIDPDTDARLRQENVSNSPGTAAERKPVPMLDSPPSRRYRFHPPAPFPPALELPTAVK